MSDIATAISTLAVNGHHDASLFVIKQSVKAEKQMVNMLQDLIDEAPNLNSSGRGQIINRYA